jgi:hypothetical protein
VVEDLDVLFVVPLVPVLVTELEMLIVDVELV